MSKNKNSWFEIKALHGEDNAGTVDIYIYSEIGGWGISSLRFVNELKSHENVSKINLYVNSPGGSVFDGVAIFNTLLHHKAKVDVFIEGAAFSIASLIALAGDTVNMSSNSMMMIHEPHRGAYGTQAELEKSAGELEKITQAMANTYQERSGLDRDEVLAIMKAETWFSAQEALAKGFITNITEDVKIAAIDASNNQEYAAKTYNNLPAAMDDKNQTQTGILTLLNDLKALLTSKKEPSAATTEEKPQQQESNIMKIEEARVLVLAQITANAAMDTALEQNKDLMAIAMAEKGIKSPSDAAAATAAAATAATAAAATAAVATAAVADPTLEPVQIEAGNVLAIAGEGIVGQETENAKITALQETQKDINSKLDLVIQALSGKVEGFQAITTGVNDADALSKLVI